MPIVIMFARKFWKQLLALTLVLTALISIGFSIYSWGYKNSDKDWKLAIAERDRVQAAQTKEIKDLASTLANTKDELMTKSDAQLTQILLSVKNKPLYKIDVNGRCTPSADFEKAYTEILRGK
jgi:hypothetical protein